jgi:energy-coupling factor transporter transmembrane protein EcfT
MMSEPTPKVALALQLQFILSYFLIPIPIFFFFLLTNIALLLFSSIFRRRIAFLFKIVVTWIVFLFIVGLGRVVGGSPVSRVWLESLQRFEFIFTVMFLITLAYLYIKPPDFLKLFDRMKIPRAVSYVFLSVLTVIDYVASTGSRQLHLLKIKGLGPSGFTNRIKVYYRVVGPLFSTLFNRQMVHARSMYYRGFFDNSSRLEYGIAPVTRAEIRWVTLIIFNFFVSLSLTLWLLK